MKLDDQQITVMEELEGVQKKVTEATKEAQEFKRQVESQLAELVKKEENSLKRVGELQSGREELAAGVEEGMLLRYERLRKTKGGTVLAGIQHGVCAGCHMKLPTQIMVTCKGGQDIVACPNCGRLLYHTSDMNLEFID